MAEPFPVPFPPPVPPSPTGPLPARLASEKVVVAAPMSFQGSMLRLHHLFPAGKAWIAWATLLVPLAWLLVAAWYCCFGLFLVPYRLIRRGSRKRKVAELRHREMIELMGQRQGNAR